MTDSKPLPYAPTLLRLLQGPVYQDDGLPWELLLSHRLGVVRHFSEMGLELQLRESEGFAFLRQPEPSEHNELPPLPRLIRRIPLSFEVTVGCVLLRERLLLFENTQPDASRLVLPQEELRQMLRPFFRETTNEVKLQNRLDQTLTRLSELGFLKALKNEGPPTFEVRRLIKAKLDAQALSEIKTLLDRFSAQETQTI